MNIHRCLFQSLKNHAVTLFEVGKLSDEALDNFVDELQNVFFFALYCDTIIKRGYTRSFGLDDITLFVNDSFL